MNTHDLAFKAANGMLSFDAEGEWRLNQKEVERFATLVRAQTLEEAAGVCDDKHDEWRFGDGEDSTSGPKDCAVAIRQLKDKT